MKLLRILLLGLACAAPAITSAQYQWIDPSGRKVFSDQPPPAEVPDRNVLKRPGGKAASAETTATTAVSTSAPATAAASAAKPASAPKISGKDKELEEKRKQAEAAEAEKKKAEEERVAKARAENCARAKQSKADYDSGVRISRTNDKGEREILDDAQRAAESKRLQQIIDSDCKPLAEGK